MSKVQCVVGALYGDEGKGLLTDYFAHQNPNAVIIRYNGSCQAGHCQTADTLVITEQGIYSLYELVGTTTNNDRSYPLLNMNNEVEQTSLLFTEAHKSINKITLLNGIELKQTDAHKYYVWNGQIECLEWVQSIHLNSDIHQFIIPKEFPQYVGTLPMISPVVNDTDYVHNKNKLDINRLNMLFLSKLCGLINGDGYFIKGGVTIAFDIKQIDVVDWIVNELSHVGISVRTWIPKISTNCIMIRFYSSDLLDILSNQLGFLLEKKEYKQTPRFIMRGTLDIIKSYIQGLFDADGTIKFHKQRNNISGQISFSNISKSLIYDTQQLLLLFGINSKIVPNKNRPECKLSWTLLIASYDNIKLFSDKIGFLSEYKSKKLIELVNNKNNSNNINRQGYILKISSDTKKKIKGARHTKGVRTGLISNLDIDGLINIKDVSKNYHIINIKQIELGIGIEQVYDVTMPITHSYIANGCISHNTVVCPDNTRHIFSHFGSGTLLNRETILSEHFVVHPILFKQEYNELMPKLSNKPTVYVHPDCMVTTPYEMIINQVIENRRGKDRHGSVGIGFGETFERHCYTTLHVSDLYGNKDDLREKLMLIRDRWVPSRIQDCQGEHEQHLFEALNSEVLLDNFIADCEFFVNNTLKLEYDIFQKFDLIFEGAQGLMLDQTFGFFPHVTRSNTGLKNIIDILKHFNVEEFRVNHLTRAYTTRHGAGPLEFESEFPAHIIDNTNHSHIFQGSLRYSPLNLDDLHEVITKDYDSVQASHSYDIIDELTVTCLDQLLDTVPFINNGKIQYMPKDQFVKQIYNLADYTSVGPTRNHVRKKG